MNTSRKLTQVLLTIFSLMVITSVALAADPGIPYPDTAETSQSSDQRPGSVLIFNGYTSDAGGGAANTKINVTNTSMTSAAFLHVFFVDGSSCSVADYYTCLTANQTYSILASDFDPGFSGYVVVVAVDGVNGIPARHNYLIGDEYIKYATGHEANLAAEAYAKLTETNVLSTDGSLAALFFDGLNLAGSYDRVSRTLALDNIPSRAEGNDTLLVINRVGGNLGTSAAQVGTLFGLLFDDAETPYSFNIAGGCQFRQSLSNSVPRTVPRFETVIPGGRTGWMKLYSQSDIGIIGAMINKNGTGTSGAYNGGHNLHKLTLSSAANLVIPVFPPSC